MIIGLTALALIMGLLGRYVAKEKNRSKAEGFWLGFLFSIFGVIIVALLPTIEKEIPAELTDERRKEMELKAEALSDIKPNSILFWLFALIITLIITAILWNYYNYY